MAEETTSLARKGEEMLETRLLPDNLLAFYYENDEYRKAESEGIVPSTRQIVIEMLIIMLDIEDERLLEKITSDIICYDVEIQPTDVVDPRERIRSMLEAARESQKSFEAKSSLSDEEMTDAQKQASQKAKRLALGVIQSNTESSYLRVTLGCEVKYVVCTSKPCTPLRVLLWITKEEKSASDYLEPSSSDFNPSLISRIESVRRLIRNGIKCVLLYEIGNDLSETDKLTLCEKLRAKLGVDLSFHANLPKGFFESEDNLSHSGALCYSVERNGGPSSSFSFTNVDYAFSVSATQHTQHPHLDTIFINAGNPRHDPKIGQKFEEAFKFVAEFLPEEFTKDVDLQRPSASKE